MSEDKQIRASQDCEEVKPKAPGDYEDPNPVEGIPYCHLFNPTSPSRYIMQLVILVPKGKEVFQIDVPSEDEYTTSRNTCCDVPSESLYQIVVNMRDHSDPNHPAETKVYIFDPFFEGNDPSCHDKIGVRVVVDGDEKGKTVIRTIDADSYGG